MAEKFAFIWMVLALPIPFILTCSLMELGDFANILLGISQGLTWSSTVVMKMDLVGEKIVDWRWDSTSLQAISPLDLAFLSGYIAEKYGLPLPFLSELEFP
jgi:hypothetical protein